MRRIIAYYVVSMLMTIYFERAVLRYAFREPRAATHQTERPAQPRSLLKRKPHADYAT
jgi:hypothetical protein